MLEPKEKVLDRIEQTFYLFKKDFFKLFIPILLFNFFTLVVLWNILFFVFFKIANFDFISEIDTSNFSDYLSTIYYNLSIFLVLGMFVFLFYITIFIPIQISLIKSIKQSFLGENIDVKENLIYGFKKIHFLFKTYYYKFIYVAGIPSFIIIVGGLLLNFGLYGGFYFLKLIGFLFLLIGIFLLLTFSIYRGYKSIFSIYSAIDHEEYTQEDFRSSVIITNNKWFDIFGNFILLAIIIYLLSSLIGGIISIFSFSINSSFSNIIENPDQLKNINLILESFTKITIGGLISESLSVLTNTIISVYMFTFTYIYFKRLELDKSSEKKENLISSEKIDL